MTNRVNWEIGHGAQRVAIYYSSGAFKQAVFDTSVAAGGLGAPYGHGSTGWLGPRGDIPYGFAGIINIQSGVFRSSWRLREISMFGSKAVILDNTASYATYLEHGTRLMIARPIQEPIEEFIRRAGPIVWRREFDALLRRCLKG